MFAARKTDNVSSAANYIEEVFSTYLFSGNSASQTITNGIDLSGKGGMVWFKDRTLGSNHRLTDTVRGSGKSLLSNSTAAEQTATGNGTPTSFSSTGFVTDVSGFGSSDTYVTWTFRKQAKFFDVVTFTKNASTNQRISHNLGATPGCIIVKSTDAVGSWTVWHRSLASATDSYLILNSTGAATASANAWGSTGPTSTDFGVSSGQFTNGTNYVAYLFAHDAGGFGATGSDNVISCGSFTTDGSGIATVNLGYEPQWIMFKASSTTSQWPIFDSMRGWTNPANNARLFANLSNAETSGDGQMFPTATGFASPNGGLAANATHIYVAIRRGPMKTPTSGTSVFSPVLVSQTDIQQTSGGTFPPDFVFMNSTNGTSRVAYVNQIADRLRSLGTPSDTFSTSTDGVTLTTSSTAIEDASNSYIQLKANGIDVTRGAGWNSASYGNFIYYLMRRSPGFLDVVCYTGTGSATTFNHNLTVVPELMIVKSRNNATNWAVYCAYLGGTNPANRYVLLNSSQSVGGTAVYWNDTAPTSTVFTVGTTAATNTSSYTYVNYLFATVAGVSKVGSYTGTGTTKQIDCGFTAGARFVMIKRTDSTGDWYVWDTARGIVSGNDPYLLLNSTAAEVTSTDYIDPLNAGFEISSTAPADINANGGTFIFLAIA